MTVNPLILYIGLSVATVGGLVVVQQQKHAGKKPLVAQQVPVAKQNSSNQLPSSVVSPEKQIPKQIERKVASLPPAKFTPVVKPPITKTPAFKAPAPKQTPPPSIDNAKKPKSEILPIFDMVRVEQDGGAVIAGRAAPSADVVLKLNNKIIGRTKANNQGDWVFIPDQLIPSGSHEIVVEAKGKEDTPVRSKQTIIIAMAKGKTSKPLVVIATANAATKVVQKPVSAPIAKISPPKMIAPNAIAPKIKNVDGVVVTKPLAKKPVQQPKAQPPMLAFGTVDYDDGGAIVFSGTANVGKTVRLYVNNKFIGQGIAGANGNWVFSGKENIAPGSHELRADLIDKDGKVTKRTAVPFVRAEPKKVASLLKSRAVQKPVETKQLTGTKEPVVEKPTKEPAVVQKRKEIAKQTKTPEKVEPQQEKPKLVSHVVIQPGNNLWNISRVIYGKGVSYTTIYQANKDQIKNPHRIYPGQIFDTPGTQSTGAINPEDTGEKKNDVAGVPN